MLSQLYVHAWGSRSNAISCAVCVRGSSVELLERCSIACHDVRVVGGQRERPSVWRQPVQRGELCSGQR